MLKHTLLLIFLVTSSACTIVQINGAVPTSSVQFGVLKLELEPGARTIAYRSHGAGLVPGTTGLTLGFAREETVLVYDPDDCRVVIFQPPQDAADRQWLAALLDNPNICRTGDSQ